MAVYEFGPYQLNTTEYCLIRDGQSLIMAGKLFEILVLLVENKGHLITKETLMQHIWPETVVEESNLTVSMSRIRSTLAEPKPRRTYIETIPRRGYRFIAEVRNVSEARIDSIAILPFTTEESGWDMKSFSDRVTESLTYRLSKSASLKVAPSSSVYHYQAREISPPEMAMKLGVKSVLTGRIVRQRRNVVLSIELLDAHNNILLWGEQYCCKLTEISNVESDIAQQIITRVNLACLTNGSQEY